MKKNNPPIRRRRHSKGMTQQDLANATGIKRSQISSYEIGAYIPSLRNAAKLAKALGCTLDVLAKDFKTKEFK